MAILASTFSNAYTFQTLDGTNIADEYVTVGALASGDNTINLPANIANLPIDIIPVTAPDGVGLLVKSFSAVAQTPASPLEWASGTTYAANALVTYNGQTYVSLQASNTNHNPGSSPTYWMLGNASMIQVVLNAANTASSGCTLRVRVGTD